MKSRIYIILGAGSGLGHSVSTHLSKNCKIFGIYNKSKKTDSKNIKYIKLDLSTNKNIDKFFENYEKKFRKYSEIVLVSFVTLSDKKIITNNSTYEIKKIINLNIISIYYFVSKLIKLYLGKKISIILTSSSRAIIGDKGISLYSISKNSMHSLAKSLAIEYGSLNVRANVISLGLFRTELWNKLALNIKEKLIENTSIKRMGKIHELNSTIKYVSNCNYLNGCILNLDGGYGLN